MRIEWETKLDYGDVLIKPKRSKPDSRRSVDLTRRFEFYHSPKKWEGIPIIASNMATCGTFEMAEELAKHHMITAFHKYYSEKDFKKFFKGFNNPDSIAYSLGIRASDIDQFKKMKKAGLLENFSFICLDVPNGYIENFLDQVKYVRDTCLEHIIIAGNVVTNEMTEDIIRNGADIVKVGIGSGAVCTTRKMTGVGYPQLSATIECADASHGLSSGNKRVGRIISDGGIVEIGDLAKSYGAGADFIMCGSLFSGFEESGGKTVEKDGIKYKEYFGSSSNKAMIDHYGKKESHRASEGRYTLIPHKGPIEDFIQDLLGGLRSAGTYIGARSLKEFSKRTTFIRVNRQLNTSIEKYDTKNS